MRINSHGLRDFEYPYHTPERTFRILVFGDSVEFAYGANMKYGYTKVLEKRLNSLENKKYNKVEVINTGHPGFNTRDQYNYLRLYGLNYSPDILVVGVNSTDFVTKSLEVVIIDGVDSKPRSLWLRLRIPSVVKKVLRKSHLYMAVGFWVAQIRYKFRDQTTISKDTLEKVLAVTNDNFEKIILLASQNKLPVYFTAMPDKAELVLKAYGAPQFYQKLKDLENENKAVFIDMMEPFAKYSGNAEELYVINDPLHLSAKGHQVFADRLYDNLISTIQ